jgi:phospholipid-binding lipoprotein MlaA
MNNLLKLLLLLLLFNNIAFAVEKTEQNQSLVSQSDDSDFDDFDDNFNDDEKQLVKVYDPLESYNRSMTKFNDKLYENIFFPISDTYKKILPQWSRRCVSNFYDNLYYPVSGVNNLLQLKFKNFFTETMRFLVNSTFGVFGLFDIAKDEFDLDPRVEDFGQTLGHYGMGPGFHFVLPILGQSNIRDVFGRAVDMATDPTWYIDSEFMDEIAITLGIKTLGYINYSSLLSDEYRSLRDNAIDFYIMQRNIYESMREKEIKE